MLCLYAQEILQIRFHLHSETEWRLSIFPVTQRRKNFKLQRDILYQKQLEEHGLNSSILKISDKAIKYIISHYTREAGVRNLEREIANLCRKVAKYIAEDKKQKFYITPQKSTDFLVLQSIFLKKS